MSEQNVSVKMSVHRICGCECECSNVRSLMARVLLTGLGSVSVVPVKCVSCVTLGELSPAFPLVTAAVGGDPVLGDSPDSSRAGFSRMP